MANVHGTLRRRLLGGGTDGNEQLTAITGTVLLVLLVLLAVLGITIVRIGQLMWLHLFLGIVLVGPVALKLSSTGYRFVRYYTSAQAYRRKGPPHPLLRALGPLVILSTVGVFLTGAILLIEGPSARPTFGLLHKLTFFLWLAAMAPHVLGHLAELPSSVRAVRRSHPNEPGASLPGGLGRPLALISATALALLLAIALLPDFSAWTR